MSKLLQHMRDTNDPGNVYYENTDNSEQESPGFFDGVINAVKGAVSAASDAVSNFSNEYTNAVSEGRPMEGFDSGVKPVDWSDSNYSNVQGLTNAYKTPEETASEQEEWRNMGGLPEVGPNERAIEFEQNHPFIDSFATNALGGAINVAGGIGSALGYDSASQMSDEYNKTMARKKQEWDNNYGADNYVTNPGGLTGDIGNAVGSTLPTLATSALVPGGAVAVGGRALTSALTRAGLGKLATSTVGRNLIADVVRGQAPAVTDSLSEAGSVKYDLMNSGMSEPEAREKAITMGLKNYALDSALSGPELFVAKGAKGINKTLLQANENNGIPMRVAKGTGRVGAMMGTSGITEGYQEGTQQALENQAKGDYSGNTWNPLEWTEDEWDAARRGGVGGMALGAPANIASAVSNNYNNDETDFENYNSPWDPTQYDNESLPSNPIEIQDNNGSVTSQPMETQAQENNGGGTGEWNPMQYSTDDEYYNNNYAEDQGDWDPTQYDDENTSGGGSQTSTGNANIDAVRSAAKQYGIEPEVAEAIAARESGGDDINAINMADNGGIMQITEDSATDYGIDEMYPNWRDDPNQNALAGMYILSKKIEENGGDTWDGVRGYNGSGEAAENYLAQVQSNYNALKENGGGESSGNVDVPSEQLYDVSDVDGVNADGETDLTKQKLNLLARDYYQKYGKRLWITSMKRDGDGSSDHDSGQAFDTADDNLEQDADARNWLIEQGAKYGLTGLDEYSHPSANATGGHVHFSDHGSPISGAVAGGGKSGGFKLDFTKDNEAYQKQQEKSDQEYNSDMDEIGKSTAVEDSFKEADNEANEASKQQEANAKMLAPETNDTEEQKNEMQDYIDNNYIDDIGEETYNAVYNALKSNKPEAINNAYHQVRQQEQRKIEMVNKQKSAPKQQQSISRPQQATTNQASTQQNIIVQQQSQPQQQSEPIMTAQQEAQNNIKQQKAVQNNVEQQNGPAVSQEQQTRYLNRKSELMKRVPSGATEKVHAVAGDNGNNATYKLMPASDVVASHTVDYNTNGYYPQDLQPRNRERPTMQLQVEKMSNNLDPSLLSSSNFVNEGAPVVDKRGVVINGNGRTMAIQRAYKKGGFSAGKYQSYLTDNADKFGLTKQQVQSIHNPILVRQVDDTADVDAIKNSTEGGARLGASEQAAADSNNLKDSTLDLYVDNDNGAIGNPANNSFLRQATHDIENDSDKNMFYNDAGRNTPYAVGRVKNAMFALAYKNDYLLAKMSESTDNNIRNIMNAMIASAVKVARVNRGIGNGDLFPDYNVSKCIADTAQKIMALRAENKPLSFYLNETSLFDESVSTEERLMLEFIDKNKFKVKNISNLYKTCCDKIFAIGSPKQTGLFSAEEAPHVKLEDIIRNAIKEVENNGSVQTELSLQQGEADERGQGTVHAESAGNGRVSRPENGRMESKPEVPKETKVNNSEWKNAKGDNINANNDENEHKEERNNIDENAKSEQGKISEGSKNAEDENSKNEIDKLKMAPYQNAVDNIVEQVKKRKLSVPNAKHELIVIATDANKAHFGEFNSMENVKGVSDKLTLAERNVAQDIAYKAADAMNNEYIAKKEKEREKKNAVNPFGDVAENERKAMEALGVKPHKKPTLPKAKAAKKLAGKKAEPTDTINKRFQLVDTSDKAIEETKRKILAELSKLNANPMFNPTLMYNVMKLGAIHIQLGANKFADWAAKMEETLKESKPFLQSAWNALNALPNGSKLDEKQITTLIQYVGSMYYDGVADKTDLRKRFIAALGVRNSKYFDAAYQAVLDYPTTDDMKGVVNNANDGAGTMVERVVQGANQNAMGPDDEVKRPNGGNGQSSSTTQGKQEERVQRGEHVSDRGSATGGKTGDSGIQGKESENNADSSGSTGLSRSVRDSYERNTDDDGKRPSVVVEYVENGRNHEADTEVKENKRLENIRKEMPWLLPDQARDVDFAEKRLIDNEGNGVLFTNGTGTGKTYSGLGIAKRYYDQGKKDILVVTKSNDIISQWIHASEKDFSMPMKQLKNTKDAGNGLTITTFSNLGNNHEITKRKFDMVIVDESQELMSGIKASPTKALVAVRAISRHGGGYNRYNSDLNKELINNLKLLRDKLSDDKENGKDTTDSEKEYREAYAICDKAEAKTREDYQSDSKAKVVFLSATPFPYIQDIDYANGYLFNYSDKKQSGGYNESSGKEQFFIDNFGYRMRYNRLTKPDGDVDDGVMERQFHDKLEREGALSGRMLSSNYDYDRGFIRVDGGVGKKIDEGFDYLFKHRELSLLSDVLNQKFNYLSKRRLLEGIKAKESIPIVNDYINQGKKVVVFHGLKQGGAAHPFKLNMEALLRGVEKDNKDQLIREYEKFKSQRPDLINLDLSGLKSPIELYKEKFGDILGLINGDETNANRKEAQKDFNDDNGKIKVILCQSDAAQAGISLHDTTGKYQRALINIDLPTKPVASIQIEGRIYRVGSKSNAIFRYLNTGTMFEQTAFATTIAERSGTAENLALGNMARTLKQSFIDSFMESQEGDYWKTYLPGSKTEGTGGKEKDRAELSDMSDFERAKSFYFANQKKTGRNKSSEGIDYFETPEPLGVKMVEWANLKSGERALEPSAGHGAISRWLPEDTLNTVVEMSGALVPKLQMTTPNAKVIQGAFEDFNIVNKFDAIVMNPPFGTGGKTAIEHLAKAFKQLYDGGRVIAIIPNGPSCQKHFDKWMYGNQDAKLAEDRGQRDAVIIKTIELPQVTFSRAGTKVSTKLVVIDKIRDRDTNKVVSDMSGGNIQIQADTINELFDKIDRIDVPKRVDVNDIKHFQLTQDAKIAVQSKDKLKDECKKAFPNGKIIDNGERLNIELPNGTNVVVDIKDNIVVTSDELSKAKEEHGYTDSANVSIEGFARACGKDAYIALAEGAKSGTGYHEAFHVARAIGLTAKEKKVLDAKIGNEEKQADNYAKWVQKRQSGRGTMFGKLWQKVHDVARKIQAMFMEVENVHNIMAKIESGDIYNRDETTSKTNKTNYLVTNKKITGNTRVPVIDVTNQPKINVNSNKEKVSIAKILIGNTFNIVGSDGTGPVATIKDGKHLVNSSNNRTRTNRTRRKAISVIDKILNNSVYVEKHDDVKHKTDKKYIELFAAVKDGKNIVRFRIIAKENVLNANEYDISDAKFYDIIKERTLPNNTPNGAHKLASSDNGSSSAVKRQNRVLSDTVSLSELLIGVKDRNGKNYVNKDGSLNYVAGLFKNNEVTDFSLRRDDANLENAIAPQDIIDAINDIVPVYEKSKVLPDDKGDKRYNEHGEAGFSGSYFNLKNYGRVLAMHIDKKLKLTGNKELTDDILQRYENNRAWDSLFSRKETEDLTPAQARREAVSEYGSMLLKDPSAAADLYPKYNKMFREKLADNAALKAKFDNVTTMIEAYQAQTVEAKAAANIARNNEKNKYKKYSKEWFKHYLKMMYTDWVNSTTPLMAIVKQAEAEVGHKISYEYDVQKQALMAKGNSAARSFMLLTGGKDRDTAIKILNKYYDGAITKDVTMKDILDLMRDVPREEIKKAGFETNEKALGCYLIARRTQELVSKYHDKYTRPDGFSEEDCKKIIKDAPKGIVEAAKKYWDFSVNVINIIQQQGFINEKTANMLRHYKYYCPMYRDMSDGLDIETKIDELAHNDGFVNISSPVKQIDMGGKRAILDPIESMIKYTISVVDRSERNNIGKTLLKVENEFKGMGNIVVRDPSMKSSNPESFAFSVWENGEKVIYRTTPEIYKVLTSVNEVSANPILNGSRSIAQALRRGATISPSFIVRNFIRDTISASINSQTKFVPIVGSLRGAWKLAHDKEFATRYYGSGAGMSTLIRADIHAYDDISKEIYGNKYKDSHAGIKQIKQLLNLAWNKYDSFANLIEDSTRAEEFSRAIKKGLTDEQAGYLARQVTLDFGRSGNYGKSVNRYIPFFNATIQGTDKFIRTFKDNPARATVCTMAYVVLPSLLSWLMWHDDDWYTDLDEQTKLINWCIPLGGGKHLLIPKPQEVGILFGSGVESVLRAMFDKDGKAMGEWARQVVATMTPNLLPTVISPMIEWVSNYQFWTGRQLVSTRLSKLPSEQQVKSNTTELAKAIGDTWIAKKIKLSPIAIDNFISGYFASAGRYVAQQLDSPIGYVSGQTKTVSPAKYWYEMPFVGSFVRQNGDNSEYVNRLYDLQKEMNDDKERGVKVNGIKEVDTAAKTVSKLTKDIRDTQNSNKMSAEQKRQKIDQDRTKMSYFAKKAVLKFGN